MDKKNDSFDVLKRVPLVEQNPKLRIHNFDEISKPYTLEQAQMEASRCINCKNARCVVACPASVNIPLFLQEIINGDVKKAAETIFKASSFPSICGRVCPWEDQCEGSCIRGVKGDPVAIGKLESFVGDYAIKNKLSLAEKMPSNSYRIAVIGSGPTGLSCAGELAKLGYSVTIFESYGELGGILTHGIPEYRLPKDLVNGEIERIISLGVQIKTDIAIGTDITVDNLIEKEKFDAVFIATGADVSETLSIADTASNGVFLASKYLSFFKKETHTSAEIGEKAIVIGGGNVAMDTARTLLRIGVEPTIVYRRSQGELPARLEEISHASEEGVIFEFLTNPTEIITDENENVIGLKCEKMELTEPDSSGRARPIPIKDSSFIINTNAIMMAVGSSPSSLISQNTKNLDVDKYFHILINDNGKTSRENIFAGGDVVTGAKTVVMAMEAGKIAAAGINEYIIGGAKNEKNT